MSFFQFKDGDIIYINIITYPDYTIELNGDQVTGSVYLEKEFLNANISERQFHGFSLKEGAVLTASGPFTSSIEMLTAYDGLDNEELFASLANYYDYYSFYDSGYITGSVAYRVINVPEIYYDREILTGSFTASDYDTAGDERVLYDNGRGGIYSGSLSGTLVGNVFYSEGLIVLKETNLLDFGGASPSNFKWRIQLKGTHKIPVKIFRCRAPGGKLNASTNSTYYQIPTGSGETYRNQREIVLSEPTTYITTVGLFNEDFELVGLAKVAQPVKKTESQDILFRLRLDF